MSNRITASHDEATDRVTVQMSSEDFSALADTAYFTSDYQSNAYGSGWDLSTPDGRAERSVWKRLDRVARRLSNESTKIEERRYRKFWGSLLKGGSHG